MFAYEPARDTILRSLLTLPRVSGERRAEQRILTFLYSSYGATVNSVSRSPPLRTQRQRTHLAQLRKRPRSVSRLPGASSSSNRGEKRACHTTDRSHHDS